MKDSNNKAAAATTTALSVSGRMQQHQLAVVDWEKIFKVASHLPCLELKTNAGVPSPASPTNGNKPTSVVRCDCTGWKPSSLATSKAKQMLGTEFNSETLACTSCGHSIVSHGNALAPQSREELEKRVSIATEIEHLTNELVSAEDPKQQQELQKNIQKQKA